MPRFILRVDDVGWLPPDKTKDERLSYFGRWRKALGSAGKHCIYGLIPTCIGHDELAWVQDNIGGNEELAVHGHSHARGEIVTKDMMRNAREMFSQVAVCETYIPPFNEYTDTTIHDWDAVLPGGYFLGGFPEENHYHGISPVLFGTTTHISANRFLYDHTKPLILHLEQYIKQHPGSLLGGDAMPVVVTLHATWGFNEMNLLHCIMDLVGPHLVPISVAQDWEKSMGS